MITTMLEEPSLGSMKERAEERKSKEGSMRAVSTYTLKKLSSSSWLP